jgi:hypothetical protein
MACSQILSKLQLLTEQNEQPPCSTEMISLKMAHFFSLKENKSLVSANPFRNYAVYAKGRMTEEFAAEKVKNASIESYKLWLLLSRSVPWQINKFNPDFDKQLIEGTWKEDESE